MFTGIVYAILLSGGGGDINAKRALNIIPRFCIIYLKVIIIVLISRKVRILRLVVIQVNGFHGIQEE